ncbi:MAG: hypothetical protein JW709_07175 [Sedimentisphaerales bacterium]|nr:hypothetical protein [Sedimentisphaerales bacterium]
MRYFFIVLTGILFCGCSGAAMKPVSREVTCPGKYEGHLQGIALDPNQNIYWSFTVALVKTDAQGNLLAKINVPDHHGDLTWRAGKVYVAVNLGQFNQPPGKEDSWVYVYRDSDLTLLEKVKVPQLVHGAGGMAYHQGYFVIVGGLPAGTKQNYVYIYNEKLEFMARKVLPTGYTQLGIQTACFHHGSWWFGCYGDKLLQTDDDFKWQHMYDLYFSHGIFGLSDKEFIKGVSLITENENKKEYRGKAIRAPIPSPSAIPPDKTN